MKRIFVQTILAFTFEVCFSQTVIPEWFENLPQPPPGTMYSVGYSGKYVNHSLARESAIAVATKNMVKQIKSRLAFEIEELSDGRFRLLNPSFGLSYEKDIYVNIVDKCFIADSAITDNGYFVLLAYPDIQHHISGNLKKWGNKPAWTEKLPLSKEYNYGVGIVSNYSSWVRAWKDADEYARFDLGKNFEIEARSIHTSKRDNKFIVESNILRQSYDKEFSNTIVISRWYDRENDTYYSLCRQAKKFNK